MGVAARRSAANRGVLPLGRRRRLLTEVFRISPGSVQDEPRIETNTDATGKRKKEGKGERDLERFGVVNLFRGTSSPLYIRSLAPGYFIGDGFFLVGFSSWGLLFVGGPGTLVWSERALEGPGIGVLTVFSFSE